VNTDRFTHYTRYTVGLFGCINIGLAVWICFWLMDTAIINKIACFVVLMLPYSVLAAAYLIPSNNNIIEPEIIGYTESWCDPNARVVERYNAKIDRKIDRLRHLVELGLLNRYASGSLLDCSIGTGRFVRHLDMVTKYSGMDYSPLMLDYIKKTYPEVETKQGDLKQPLAYPDNSYDIVICTRTLFALGDISATLSEMARVSSKYVIFDYSRSPLKLPDNLEAVKIHNLDGILGLIKRTIEWKFNSKYNIIPDSIYLAIGRFSLLFYGYRRLYVCRKIKI
jgi:ubiquinone/menaquinone biosynthesis C-methylase UbiE